MRDISNEIANLAPEERARLEERLLERGPAERPRTIGRRPDPELHPLSSSQQRLWFLHEFEPESPFFNIAGGFRIHGSLRLAALHRGLAEVVRRHEVLRAEFRTVAGKARQEIAPPTPPRLPVVDLGGLPSAAIETRLREVADELARRPFLLARAPLARFALIRLATDVHALLVVLHHIVADGSSIPLLLGELTTLYAAGSSGGPAALPELPLQYADYAHWEQGRLESDEMREHLDYWRERLAGCPPVLELPADRPRPSTTTFHGANAELELSASLAERVEELAVGSRATPFQTLLSMFAILLGRLTGREDVPVGSPFADRGRPELEGLVGLFANMLVLRLDLSGRPPGPSVAEVLQRTRETVLDAHRHQELPFERLVEELQPERLVSQSPLVQVSFAFQEDEHLRLDLPGLELEPLTVSTDSSKLDLTLTLVRHRAGLRVVAEYATDLFDRATVERWLRSFRTLLAAAVEDPARPVWRLPVLPAEQRHQLLHEGVAARRPVRGDELLHERVEGRAEAAPDAVAVVCEGRYLTYGETIRRARRLSGRLIAAGARPEDRVGLRLERSERTVVAILGVLGAGAAYVPLEPSLPGERLAALCDDAGIRLLVADREPADGVPFPEGEGSPAPEVVALDGSDRTAAAAAADPPPRPDLSPDNAAYVIYTSGSTGRPKGVVVTHRNAARLFRATEPLFSFSADDAWTLFHSYSFDFSVWELWGPLAHGGRVVVVPRRISRSPEELATLLAEQRVTFLNQTPSSFYQLQAVGRDRGEAVGPALRKVVFGGEALDLAALAPWYEGRDGAAPELVNMYGITETTVHVTYRPLRPADVREESGSVIGVPLSDLAGYVLDPELQPAPLGVPGELYVGGGGLARGYLGHATAVTAERFVPDPFAPFAGSPGARLYRTGDLVRRLARGELEYLGRVDQQVKIRGFRIEPGEIEAALADHPGVDRVVVVMRGEGADAALTAYAVPADGDRPAVEELRSFLLGKLPDYMVPAAFMFLDEIPLTANGKLDRRALPAPDSARPDLGVPYRPPRNAVERALTEAVAEVLDLERVGVEDSFFALGGDSIRAIQVRSEARRMGVDFSLQDLFQHQTVAALSEVASWTEEGAATGAPPGIGSPAAEVAEPEPFSLLAEEDRERMPPGIEDAYPLTRLQSGLLFHSELEPESAVYHNVNSLDLAGPLDAGALRSAVDGLVRRHPVLRTSFDLGTFGEPLQLVHERIETPLEVVDLGDLEPAEQERRIAERFAAEGDRAIDWSEPPLVRFWAHRRGERSFELGWSEHHALLDGWSVATMLGELFEEYFARLDGVAGDTVAAPASRFADQVAAERQVLSSDRAAGFWRERLAGSSPTPAPRLAAGADRDPESSAEGPAHGSLHRTLPETLTRDLFACARGLDLPPKSVLLAAHLALLARTSGEADLVTGLITHARPEIDGGERTLGLFVNAVPFRLSVDGASGRELVRRTFEAERELLPHRVYPGVEIQRICGGDALFETVFNYVRFHVLRDLSRHPRLEVVGERSLNVTHYPLLLNVFADPDGERLSIALQHSPDVLSAAQAELFADAYERILEGLVHEPDAPPAEYPLLSAAQRHQVLREWNDTVDRRPAPASLAELVAARAAEGPEAVAVGCGALRLTYGALWARAARLARAVADRGVAPEVPVAICLEPGIELAEATLAVLLAGGVCVPCDPGYPARRLATMIGLARPGLVVTRRGLRQRLGDPPPWGEAPVLDLDEPVPGTAGAAGGAADAPDVSFDPASPAYLLFTSGSTGEPKGVAVGHGVLVNLMLWQIDRSDADRTQRTLQFAPSSFDVFFQELFATWGAGGELVFVDDALRRDPQELLALLARERIGRLFLPFVALRDLAEVARSTGTVPGGLTEVVTAGEQLQSTPAIRWLFERLGDAVLDNQYGPTESHVVTAGRLPARPDRWPPLPPIGRPVPNARTYVVDPGFRPQPVGVAGELLLGGPGLARGYWNRPALTAERFLPDPWGAPGARVYRTGDLVRHRTGGRVDFLGRTDLQVKVRGFRIEPGEIEARLAEHPDVQQAVVVVRSVPGGDRQLVAYAVPADGAGADDLDRDGIGSFLRGRLPDHMIPTWIVPLESLPRTPSGKLDRRGLPSPRPAPGAGERTYEEPRTGTERELAALWSEVLGVERVGRHDDFFALGGHSLFATRLFVRLRQRFDVDLPLKALFEQPTVASLAIAVDRRRLEEAPAEAVELPSLEHDPEHRHEPFPLTDIQQAYWVGRRGGLDLGNVAAHGFLELAMEELDAGRLEAAVERLVARHEMLRAVILPDGRQRILETTPPYELGVSDLTGLEPAAAEARCRELREEMSHQVLDPESWPLFELHVARLDGGRAHLFVSLDILTLDAWSIHVLSREIALLYEDPGAELPALEVSFRDYVLATLRLRESPRYERDLAYWRSRLADLPPAPELPLARDPSTIETPRFGRRTGFLEARRWSRLQERAARAGLTPSGVLLAAFCEVLATWSKTRRFTLSMTFFNRLPMHPGIDRIVGDFTSVILLEVDARPGDTFVERARRIQERVWEDLDHGSVSGVEVMRELVRSRGGDARPVPVVFTSTLGLAGAAEGRSEDAPAPQLRGEPVYSITQTPQVWLDHQVFAVSGGLSFNWDLVEQLFPPHLADAMFEAYVGFLDRLVEEGDDADRRWRERPPALAPAAHRALVARVNDTGRELADGHLHAEVAERMEADLERPAVLTRDRVLSYGDLDRRSARLALRLREAGAEPGRLVAVVMEKCWQQAVAVFGVLRAGAAYLPIDAALPDARRHHLMERGEVELAVTLPDLDRDLDWPAGVERLTLGDGPVDDAPEPVPPCPARPRDLAYVLFTSGSTGSPKGVMIEHRAARNTVLDVNHRFAVGPEDRVLGLSSLSFDLSVYDLFGPLGEGGALVLPPADAARDPSVWLELIERHRVTVWNSVPALMEMLVTYVEGRSERSSDPARDREPALGGLRLVLLSGDWIPVDLPGRIRRFAPDAEIVSLGGATEGSIWSILHPIGEEDASRTSIPYGRPMADQTFHVFDDRLEERPAWVPGDLYIGGRGVASGYWRDEERTRAAFLEHPDTGERLYRTGDLGRWLPDGTIEFLGREDFQVQVQGHRVELGEIESVLLRHPRIRAAAVDAVGEARGTKSLVAYLVAEEGSPEPSGDGSPAASRAAAELPEELSGLILDPARRERFKEARWGLRRDRGDRSGVDLERPSLDRPRRAAYRGRRSRRRFRSEAVPVDRVGELMSCLLSETVDRETVYRYPSAGTLYPVQTYLYAAPGRVDGLAGGTYYHDPVAHRLVLLDPEARFGPEIHAPVNQPVAEGAAFTILLVGRLRAIAPMYGEVARDFCLLEAGYLSQLLMTECAAVGLGLCPVGGLDFDGVRGSLDLEEDDVFLHALLGGGLPEDDPSVADLEPGAADPERAASRKPSSARLLDSGHPLGEEVLDHLAAELPDYMVPSSLVLLDELPLTAVGKVDRKALPSPEEIRPERRKQSARPAAGAMEKAVAQAWSDVLEVGADDVGVEDNFFDLGGSSVHIVQVHRRLEEELGRELPLNALFRHSTISSLARFLEDGGADAAAVDEGLERGEARERARRRSSRRRRRRRNDGEEGP